MTSELYVDPILDEASKLAADGHWEAACGLIRDDIVAGTTWKRASLCRYCFLVTTARDMYRTRRGVPSFAQGRSTSLVAEAAMHVCGNDARNGLDMALQALVCNPWHYDAFTMAAALTPNDSIKAVLLYQAILIDWMRPEANLSYAGLELPIDTVRTGALRRARWSHASLVSEMTRIIDRPLHYKVEWHDMETRRKDLLHRLESEYEYTPDRIADKTNDELEAMYASEKIASLRNVRGDLARRIALLRHERNWAIEAATVHVDNRGKLARGLSGDAGSERERMALYRSESAYTYDEIDAWSLCRGVPLRFLNGKRRIFAVHRSGLRDSLSERFAAFDFHSIDMHRMLSMKAMRSDLDRFIVKNESVVREFSALAVSFPGPAQPETWHDLGDNPICF